LPPSPVDAKQKIDRDIRRRSHNAQMGNESSPLAVMLQDKKTTVRVGGMENPSASIS
jgi:hypothetical protein